MFRPGPRPPSVRAGEITDSGRILIYPNPASDHVALDLRNCSIPSGAIATLYNLQGEKVAGIRFDGQLTPGIPVGGLPEGVYFLKVTGPSFYLARKIVRLM